MKKIFILLFCFISGLPVCAGDLQGTVRIINAVGTSADSQGNEDAVVFVTGFEKEFLPSTERIYHDQINKKFIPAVLPIVKGQAVLFRNQDEINHNAFSLSKAHEFDLGLYKAPEEKKLTFETPGIVKVFCNIHPQMRSTILVLKNDRFFRTAPDGKYLIKNIPAGAYQLKVWVDGADLISKQVVVTLTSHEEHHFNIPIRRQTVEHLNKFGKPYEPY
ncbi:hypothetical protein WDW89_20220 [Deltaproteobacteria bacterium TL4]